MTRPAFCTPCAPNILAPAHTSFLLHVIANQCAHWCGNPFSPQRSLASWLLFGQIRDALRMRPKCCYFAMPHRRRSGLPRRFAPRNDMQKHAAVRMSNYVLPGQIHSFSVFALGTAFRHAPPQGVRIATPVCALVRNDMLKHAGVHMAMTWYHGKFVTFFVFAQSTAPPAAGDADCPVAALLAMTCRRRGRVRRCKDVGREGVQKAGACAQVQGGVARKVRRTLPRIWGCKVVFHNPCTRSPIMVHPTILPAKPGKTALTNRGRCTRISP